MTTPIPCPPSIPFLGHATLVDKEVPLSSFQLLAKQYGEAYQLNILNRKSIVISTHALLTEVCDEKRFHKGVTGGLVELRQAVGDGLFTAFPDEHNWGIAHRLLMPAFGTASIRDMFDDMADLATQLVQKWERFGPAFTIDPAEDFTRLTLDTIALCSMSYRLNSFYRDTSQPFVQAMVDVLVEAGNRSRRPGLVNYVMRTKYEQDIKIMAELADEIIANRKANPVDQNDLLNVMLNGKDPKTGEGLSDENIRNNLLTFLVAGHETTSSMLTFAIYHIVKNPEVMRKLREEIDEVAGDQPIQLGDLNKMPYIMAILRETLRLNPTAPLRVALAKADTTLGNGKYAVEKDVGVVVNTSIIQQDPKVWGDDAEEFKPERMMGGKFEALPANAWQPFGFGMRACIGRPFAIQEAQLAIASIFQKFDIVMADPSYELTIKQTLTIKPKDFHIHAIPRTHTKPRVLFTPSARPLRATTAAAKPKLAAAAAEGAQAMYVLYGSNTGTSESFAQRVASEAASYGFRATLGTLDSVGDRLPTDGPVVIITASFEGQAADNAAHFVDWLSNLKGQELANLRFAVFGCGNRDWVRTYQRIPKLCDELLEARGGKRLISRGEGDASSSDFFESFDEWEVKLWETLPKEYNTTPVEHVSPGIQITTVDAGTARAADLRQPDAALGTVIENRVLTAPGAPVKRHIEFELPANVTYRAGDYLAILPTNPPRDVQRALARFSLSAEEQVTLSSTGPTSLPVDKPISLSALFSGYVELGQPATTRDFRILLETEASPATKETLQALAASYSDKVLARRVSLLHILEDHPDIKLPLGTFLSMLPSMRIRQYSISSSPLWNPQRATLTISVVDAPALSGRDEPFLGVASTFLAGLRPGDKVQMAVRASSAAFHPPQDPTVPLVLFCAGSGLAPMRGFLQERALQKEAGREVGKALLFMGCRNPKEDYLYSDSDLKQWAELGVVDIRPAFSRLPQGSADCKYVQDRAWHDRSDINQAYDSGGKFFTCGSGKMAQGVKEVLTAIIKEQAGVSDQEAAAMFETATSGRYATDIFE